MSCMLVLTTHSILYYDAFDLSIKKINSVKGVVVFDCRIG